MRFLSEFLIVKDQVIVVLEDGKPCKHCRGRKVLPLSNHLVSWIIPRALIIYGGVEVEAVCLECLDERRAKETQALKA